jgi:hypothetical protein
VSKPTTTVSLDALRTSLERVLTEIQRRHGDEVDLAADSYWVLPAEAAYDHGASAIAGAHTLGSFGR